MQFFQNTRRNIVCSTYVVPRFNYGLEVLDLKAGDIKSLEQFQRKSLKQLQSLPDRTQNSISLALLGILPVESVLDKNMLNLFGRWIRTDGIEKEIAVRQLAMKCSSELQQYNTKFIYIVGDTNSITLAMNSYLPT